MSAPTPRPWHVLVHTDKRRHPRVVGGNPIETVAICPNNGDHERAIANAHAIANTIQPPQVKES